MARLTSLEDNIKRCPEKTEEYRVQLRAMHRKNNIQMIKAQKTGARVVNMLPAIEAAEQVVSILGDRYQTRNRF